MRLACSYHLVVSALVKGCASNCSGSSNSGKSSFLMLPEIGGVIKEMG